MINFAWKRWLASLAMLSSFASHATSIEVETKPTSFSERLKAQSLARTIYLSEPSPRGKILGERVDQQGRKVFPVLANSKNGRYFEIDFSSVMRETDPVKIYEYVTGQINWINRTLGKNVAVSENEALTYFEHRRWIPMRVGSVLSREEVGYLEGRALPEGLRYLDIPLRNYPRGASAGHLIGSVKRVKGWTMQAFAEGDELFPSIEGVSGLEQSQNSVLAGVPSLYRYEFGDDGLLKGERKLVTRGRAGLNIVLGLDVEMQSLGENLLKKYTADSEIGSGTHKGALVVVDIEKMQIKALASWPLINPNDFVPVLTDDVEARWKAERDAGNDPTISRAFQAAYPPASTFKLATGLMALSSRAVMHDEPRYRCFDSMTYGENTMKNWTQEVGAPYFTVAEALKRSCNTWFFQAANEMQSRSKSFEKWFHYFMPMLGIGLKTGLEVADENFGGAYVKDGKPLSFSEGAQVANVSIGQGDLATTPLQLAQMVARIANPSRNSLANVIVARQTEDGEWTSVDQISNGRPGLVEYEEELKTIRQGMWDVVYGDFGTGVLAKPQAPFEVVGKTGTAQWSKNRNVAWFASYAPYAAPKYAVVVMQEGNQGQTLSGGNHAAPIVSEFFSEPYVSSLVRDHLAY